MSDPVIAANQIGTRTRHLSSTVVRIVAALRLDVADGYPRGGSGARGPINEISDPTFAAVDTRTVGTATDHDYKPADNYDLLLEQLAAIQSALDLIDAIHDAKVRSRSTIADRCSRLVDPGCTNVRGTAPHGLCDHCWTTNRCPACGERLVATDPPRRLQASGERCCQPCYRAEAKAS